MILKMVNKPFQHINEDHKRKIVKYMHNMNAYTFRPSTFNSKSSSNNSFNALSPIISLDFPELLICCILYMAINVIFQTM